MTLAPLSEPWSCFIAYQSTRDGPTSLCNQARIVLRASEAQPQSKDPLHHRVPKSLRGISISAAASDRRPRGARAIHLASESWFHREHATCQRRERRCQARELSLFVFSASAASPLTISLNTFPRCS